MKKHDRGNGGCKGFLLVLQKYVCLLFCILFCSACLFLLFAAFSAPIKGLHCPESSESEPTHDNLSRTDCSEFFIGCYGQHRFFHVLHHRTSYVCTF